MKAPQDAASPLTGRPTTIVRPALVGLLSLGLGVTAHALSGGELPSVPILCGLAALTALAATLVAQTRLPGWALMLVLGASQQVLHWLLGGLGGGASSIVSGPALHHGAGEVPVGSGTGQGHSPEVMLMLHTHLAAALLVGWAAVRYSGITEWVSHRRGRPLQRPVQETEGAPIE